MTQIPQFEGGVPSFRDKLNRMLGALNALWNMRGDDDGIIRVIRNQSGVTISLDINKLLPRIPKTQPSVATQTKHVQLSNADSFSDYMVCFDWNNATQTAGTTPIYVAKAYQFQRSQFDGKTIDTFVFAYTNPSTRTRTSVGGLPVIHEIIYPAWLTPSSYSGQSYAGEIIEVIKDTDTGVLGFDNQPCQWRDLNSSGRQWIPAPLAGYVYPVVLVKDGGVNAVTPTTRATYTYTVKDWTFGTVLATGKTPIMTRPYGSLIQAANGTAFTEPTGNIVLVMADEYRDTRGCVAP